VSRRSITVVAIVVLIGAAVAIYAWRPAMIDSRPLLPLAFAHADHREVNCITCHHNYVDDTGGGLCIDCHKTNVDIRARIEPMFHDLCRDCHVEKQAQGDDAGPVRRCVDCHTADDEP
jgi:hypothetical protein